MRRRTTSKTSVRSILPKRTRTSGQKGTLPRWRHSWRTSCTTCGAQRGKLFGLNITNNTYWPISIIFTCWTRTLDLIQSYLKFNGLDTRQGHFQRIDGECPTTKRERILDDFAHNPQLRVLIMTTGTGAVGLNLATANRVFIVYVHPTFTRLEMATNFPSHVQRAAMEPFS
jgi:hypothetical protein